MAIATKPVTAMNPQEDQLHDDFLKAVRVGRVTARMSQKDIGVVIGKSQRYVSMVERGETSPRLDEAIAIAAALRPALGRNILLEVLSND